MPGGIYVGYKFYETAAKKNAINYAGYVQYPFGYRTLIHQFHKGDG